MSDRLEAVVGRPVSRETIDRLQRFEVLLKEEAARQNLISRSSMDVLWERHIVDSAQLARFEPKPGASWVDVGAGAGLPGIVLACIVAGPVTLVEPRRLRAEFLHKVVESLGLDSQIVCAKAERVEGKFDVITARAVAPLTEFIELSLHLSTRKSHWVLPKGRNAVTELVDAQAKWQGTFHVEHSLTDDASQIIVATDVRPKRT